MNRPSATNSKRIFNDPGTTTFTNTIVDAIDTPISSTDVYGYAYTATLATQYDCRNYRTVATDIDITANSRIAFGVFLDSSNEKLTSSPNLGIIYSCFGSISYFTEASTTSKCIPIFGRCDAATITQSDAAPANLLSSYITLDQGYNYFNSGGAIGIQRAFFEGDIIKIGTGDPLFFGFMIENFGTAWNLDCMHCHVQIQKYTNPIDTFDPLH